MKPLLKQISNTNENTGKKISVNNKKVTRGIKKIKKNRQIFPR